MSAWRPTARSLDATDGLIQIARRRVPVVAACGLAATATLVAATSWWAIVVLAPTVLVCILAERDRAE